MREKVKERSFSFSFASRMHDMIFVDDYKRKLFITICSIKNFKRLGKRLNEKKKRGKNKKIYK